MKPTLRIAATVIGLAWIVTPGGGWNSAEAAAGEATAARSSNAVVADAAGGTREQRIASGEKLFNGSCSICHGANGTGMATLIPPLARSDFIAADPKRAVAIVVNGYRGRLTVNGIDYNATMPRLPEFGDAEFADILTYVFNAWGNDWGSVTAAEVAAARTTVRPGQVEAR